LDADNAVGAPYVFMTYIHGTVAAELSALWGCQPNTFGTESQDARFLEQMANIQTQLAHLTFDCIGSLRQGPSEDTFEIGPEIETGLGPWKSQADYYKAVVRHRSHAATQNADPASRERKSITLPERFAELASKYLPSNCCAYALTNRDFGAHNVLVDKDFSIVGLIDLDGVMAAPLEMVAQFPFFMGLDRPAPGHVESRPLALKRQERVNMRLSQYVRAGEKAVKKIALERKTTRSETFDGSIIADQFMSDAASLVQGLDAYTQHQAHVNDSWFAAYDVLQRKADARVQKVIEVVQRLSLYSTTREPLTPALEAKKAVFNVKE
jgi:hypothetical protein